MLFRRRALVCRQSVSLMTEYLDGALDQRDRDRLEAHLAGCPIAASTSPRSGRPFAAAGHVEPDDLSPEALDDLVALYRRRRSE
jgi:anti-sigma factor RsiW